MSVRTCEEGNLPGYQSVPETGDPGVCHTYDPADVQARDAALRAAARDAVATLDTEAAQAGPPAQ